MRSIVLLGSLIFALSFCGLQDRLKGLSGGSNTPSSNTASSGGGTTAGDKGSAKAEKASPTSAQQAIIDGGTEVKWDDQGVSWRLPAGWSKMDVKKESFNYKSTDNAFLLVNISVMPDTFPLEQSLAAYHEQALQQLKNGKYIDVKLVEIDGVPGVEFVEAMPEDKTDSRRHQWIGFRTYLGQKQQINVMTATRGTNFEKHTDDFAAIIYSAKFTK